MLTPEQPGFRLGRAGPRLWWTTVLDAAIILVASIAVVMVLGASTKLIVGGIPVLLIRPWRPALWAAALCAVRVGLSRDLPPLPALADPGVRAGLDTERARFASPPPTPRGYAAHAAAVALASIVWLTPHLFHLRQIPDPGDPVFSAWRLARFAHQLAHDPRHLFDGNIFYPERWTLTYSDATVLQGIAGAPFILGGADPLIVSNALFLAAFPLCGLAFFHAGWRLSGDVRAAFLTGLLGALHPFHTEHYSHLELQYFFFVPLAIVALLDLLAAPTPRKGLLFGAAVSAQWLASMYLGIMLMTFLVPFGILVAIGWRVRPTLPLLRAGGAAAVLILAALAAVGAPYLNSRGARGDRSYGVVGLSSALPSDYGRPHAGLASHGWHARDANLPERALFPGFVTPALAAAGLAPPLGAVATATIVSGALGLDWSFGTNGLTYGHLYRWVLPYRGMRVAARFSVFVGTALILLAAYGTSRILRRCRDRRVEAIVFMGIAAAALIDLRPAIALRAYWRTVPPIYASVGPGMVLAEFPFEPGVDQMYFSTRHWARLLNGYSGFFPGSFIRMAQELDTFPSERALDALRAAGATHLTVNCALYARPCEPILAGLDGSRGVRQVSSGTWENKEVRLYELIRSPAPADGRSR